ncbi:MAG: hypothetical protein ACOCRX_00975 [Candidatus Woesearchaeota archaeon]
MSSFFNFFIGYVKYKEYRAFRSDKYDCVEKEVNGFKAVDIFSEKINKRYLLVKSLSDLDLSGMDLKEFDKIFFISPDDSENKKFLISNFESFVEISKLFFILMSDSGEVKLNVNPYLVQFSNFGNKSISKIINKLYS